MRGRFLGRFGHDGHAEPAADHLRNRLERHAFLGDRVIVVCGCALLEREPVDARGVKRCAAGPAVAAIADIGRHAFLAREVDQDRNEAVVALAMGGRRKTNHGGADAGPRQRRSIPTRGGKRCGLVVLGGEASRRQQRDAGGDEQGRLGALELLADRQDRAAVELAIVGRNFEKSWLKPRWSTPSEPARAAAQEARSSSDPRWTSAPIAASAAAPASERARPETRWPAAIRSWTTAEPTKPVAPVTKTRMRSLQSWWRRYLR